MVSRKAVLIATGLAVGIAGCTGAASQPQQPFDNRREICRTLIEQIYNPRGAEAFAALQATRTAADNASVFDYKDVASLRELLRRALAANRAIDLADQALANIGNCIDPGELEKQALRARSEVAHWENLAREYLKALDSNGGH